MSRVVDIAGQRFGRLIVLSRAGSCKSGSAWSCQCDCGRVVTVSSCHLRSSHTKSCGCEKVELLLSRSKKHGMSNKTPTYKSWKEMRSRCNNKNNDNYKWYGGAGISVCDRWDSYESFLEDMGERPAGTSIDRIDVTGNYEPSNCRWATPSEQAETNRGCIKKGCTPPNKLPQEEIKLMIEMRKSGAKIKDIAMRFGRHSSNVSVWLRYGN